MASPAEIQSLISAALEQQSQQMQALLASRDDAISQLMAKVKLQEAELAASPKASKLKSQPMVKIQLREAVTPPNSSVKSSGSKPAPFKARPLPSPSNKKSNRSASEGNRKSAAPTKSNQSTPCQPKRNVTPKTDCPKVNPLQMISRDMPKSFSLTRDALYVHIKLIWNLLEQKAIPSPPHPNTILEFTSRFSNADKIERTANDTSGAALIPVKEVVTFKDIKCGRKKVGKGLVNLEEFFVSYTQAILARLGIRVWAPDLEDLPDSLYNEACRQAALKSFRQASRKNQTGKFRMDEERKVISKARERLRDSRLKFALSQGLPKRYQKVISDVNCHSDDEYNSQRKVYVVKTLKFRSANATKFFRRLDATIATSDELDGKRVQRRRRFIPPTPEPSLFTKPPKGQPLDFYNPEWFNELLPQQRIDIANTREVAFLPNASQSLMGKKIASEKLSDKKFTAAFFDQLSKPYDLTHEIEDNGDDETPTDDEDDASYNGEEIDLANTSGDDDEEDDEDVDFDILEDPMDLFDPDQEQEEDDGGDNEEEELAREARLNAMMIDDEGATS
ncbi:hypothetical protein H4Q26_015668 [Puccinia striiformis f. sp. tritici PST-130]|nr:hypothetical protein H4Q26_015668 [Puccinia striiformis f. sp. tritici PST-130]